MTAFKQAFDAVLTAPVYAQFAQDLFSEPGAAEALLHETLPKLSADPARARDNVDLIVRGMFTRQTARIDSYLAADNPRARVAFFCPSRAYRHTFGDADTHLRERGVRVAKLFAEYVNDAFEKSEGAFFAPGDIPTQLTKLDFLFTATLIDYATACPKILAVHDIFDSPLGDEVEFRRLARGCYGFFMPSTLGVESMQRVFAPIAKPDEPAAAGKRHVIIRGGYPRLDQNIAHFEKQAVDEKTIIYAPTLALPEFEKYVSMPRWSEGIVEILLDRFPEYRVIFRPHPHAFYHGHGLPAVQSILNRFGSHPRFELDRSSQYMATYSRAAIMVSDTSGTAYTYAFTTGRPVVFFSPNDAEAFASNPGVRYFEFRERVGLVAHDLEGLASNVAAALTDRPRFHDQSLKLRNEVVFNVGSSVDYLVSIFEHLKNGTDIPNAIYFRT
jgi:hypothetical protein